MLEDKTFSLTSHIFATERPDRAARALTEGRVVLILNGSPRALIMPTNAFELTHAVSDDYLRVPYANMSRIIRMLAMFFSILLPDPMHPALPPESQEQKPNHETSE